MWNRSDLWLLLTTDGPQLKMQYISQSLDHFCMQKRKCLFNRDNVLEDLRGLETWVSWSSIPQRGIFAICAKSSGPIQHGLVRKVHRKEIQRIGHVKISSSTTQQNILMFSYLSCHWIQVMLSLLLQQTIQCRELLHKKTASKDPVCNTLWLLSNRISRWSKSSYKVNYGLTIFNI